MILQYFMNNSRYTFDFINVLSISLHDLNDLAQTWREMGNEIALTYDQNNDFSLTY